MRLLRLTIDHLPALLCIASADEINCTNSAPTGGIDYNTCNPINQPFVPDLEALLHHLNQLSLRRPVHGQLEMTVFDILRVSVLATDIPSVQ